MSDVVLRPTTPPAPLYLKGVATIKGVGDPRTRFEAGLHMMHANADQVRVFLYLLGDYTSSFVCVCVSSPPSPLAQLLAAAHVTGVSTAAHVLEKLHRLFQALLGPAVAFG